MRTEFEKGKMSTIIDLNAEAEKLTTLNGATPQATPARRKGGMARLGSYRDGILLLGASTGTGRGHWETHPEDELVYVLDGAASLDIVQEDGPHSLALSAGMIAVVPPGAWHRFRSADGRTTVSATMAKSITQAATRLIKRHFFGPGAQGSIP